jgi:hypothetical protein
MAVYKDKRDKEERKGPRTAKDLREERQRRIDEHKNKGNRRHVNKFMKQHQEEVEARKKSVRKTTPGATQELQYIQNHIYSLDEIRDFDIGDAIDENALSNKSGHVRSKLAYKFIMENKNITAKYLLPGQICMFSYNDPKTIDELEYWDKTPLTLFFGAFRTKNGDIREIGLNLHYYPPFTRRKILVKVYETFKSYFQKCFNHPQHKPNTFMDYKTLKHLIGRDSKIAFGVKEYVPMLRGITYVIPTKMLPIAFYTEGHFSRATIMQVQQFWRQFKG